jgi:fatty acid desaturase
MELYPASFYVKQLRGALPRETFRPAPSRLLWLPVHLTVIAGATLAVASRWAPWPSWPVLSLVIGMSFAGLMFLGHEVLHGAVVRGRWAWLRPLIGWVCFAPFALSQQLWVIWHNRVHHANTNNPGMDPDMYPTLEAYRRSRYLRFVTDNFALGGRRLRGLLSLFIGFSVQSQSMLFQGRRRLGMTAREHAQAILETLLAIGLWASLAVLVGLVPFLFVYVIALVVANLIVMAFILTNHGLSPATRRNDPLINALSVTAPRWVEWLTLGFGYHVEHHLLPAMCNRHAGAVRAKLLMMWPERYQTMNLVDALEALHRSGRVYKDEITLVDPRSGGEWPALAPREPGPPRAREARDANQATPNGRAVDADGAEPARAQVPWHREPVESMPR